MAQGTLINCKKCGTLFIKGTRDICDSCFKHEVELADKVKSYIEESGKAKVTMEEILFITKIPKVEFEKLFEKGRLFSVMNKITIKCRFCGIEFECEQKASFVCPKCIMKFSKKGELGKINQSNQEAKKQETIVRQTISDGKTSRYGFIQNYEV